MNRVSSAEPAFRFFPVMVAFTALLAACNLKSATSGHCQLGGSDEQCSAVLLACAKVTGRTPLELCRAVCERQDGLAYACSSGPSGTIDGLYAEDSVPEPDSSAEVAGEIQTLDCSTCLFWNAETACSPGHTFCEPTPVHGQPLRILLCDDEGRTANYAGQCTAPDRCSDPTNAATWSRSTGAGSGTGSGTSASSSATLPPVRFEVARCVPAACEPGAIRCPLDTEGIEVCDPAGQGWVSWTSCPEQTKPRCGPDPVCLPVPGTPCASGEVCDAGSRCTLPGLFGEPRACAPTAAEGQPCSGDSGAICAAGLRCVVEAAVDSPRPPAAGVCRPACDPNLSSCPAGMACLATAAGGVCSAAVHPGQREACDTGLPGVCARGVRNSDGVCQQLVTQAGTELCDGLDNDCDGQTDEDAVVLPSIAPCPDLGVCKSSGAKCDQGRWVCDVPATWQAEETLCDGLDNDCDGQTDEGCD